jgi:hypothetical protein
MPRRKAMVGKWSRERVAFYSTVGVSVFVALLMAGGAASAAVVPASVSAGKTIRLHAAIELQSPVATFGGEFGLSVAVGNGFIAVGAPDEFSFDAFVTEAGNVYVYNSSNGYLEYILDSPNEIKDGHFGLSVAASGETLIIGAPGEDSIDGGYVNGGNAYQWNVTSRSAIYAGAFLDPIPQTGGAFGYSVAVSGTNVLIGAPGDWWIDTAAGLADVYSSNNQELVNTFFTPNPALDGFFGLSVAISGSNAYIGAPYELNDAGHAYLITGATGLSPTTYTFGSPIGQSDGAFGYSVAADSKYFVVGAEYGNASGVAYGGSAYVYRATNGNFERTLYSPDPQSGASFGGAVAVSGSTVVVAATLEIVDGTVWAGEVCVFDASNGRVHTTLYSPNSQVVGYFGASVAVAGNTLAVGAAGENSSGYGGAGNAYIY